MNLFLRLCVDSMGVGTVLLATLAVAGQGEAPVPASQPAGSGQHAITSARESTPLVRFRFDEPVELRLDPDRIAVCAPDGVGPVLPAVIAPGSAQALGIPGWHLLRLEAPVDVTDLSALLWTVASASRCEFVSPVFVDDLGGPLVPTPDLLVQFEPDVEPSQAEAVLASLGAGEILDRDWGGLPRAFRVRSTDSNGLTVLSVANALAQRPDVRFAEPDFMFTGQGEQSAPNDPSFARSWGLNSPGFIDYCPDLDWDMGALEAWQVTQGDPSVRVLIIDNGIDPSHPDLNLDPGEDFTGQGSGGAPFNACDNHGTRVAGCVSMIADNSLGSAGIAPGCKSVSARCFISNTPTCNGGWSSNASWTVYALQWAETNGIWITNNSNIYGFTSSAIEAKYQQTRAAGAVHFACSGNAGQNQVAYPAKIPSVNAIGNFSYGGYVHGSSNYGPEIAFVAPGTYIFTTDRSGPDGWSGDFGATSGTSLASPYAAGVAALLRSMDPTLSSAAVEARMCRSALDVGPPGWDEYSGWGLVRVGRALTMHVPTHAGFAPLGSAPPPEPRGTCERPCFSDDGRYVAFQSDSAKLVAGDNNGVSDVFRRDLQTQAVVRVSVDWMGAEADSESRWPAISADGRFVAFQSRASLVAGDTNDRYDVFLHDTLTGVTTRVSEGNGGIQSDSGSYNASISADGRYLAFQSWASNFDPAANGNGLVYVHDRLAGTTTLATRTAGGEGANKSCHLPSISDDGMRVAFYSKATNLVTGANGATQAFVCDLGTSSCFLASVDTAGAQGTKNSYRATISGDGGRVAFWTTGALDPADTNGLYDVYVRDLVASTTLAASTDATGAFGTRDAFGLQLSVDGRYVVVLSANPLVPGDTNEHIDAFRKDLQTGFVVRVSLGPAGQQAMGGSTQPWISSDGGMVGFVNSDDTLTPGDELDSCSDVYLHTVSTGQTVLATGGS